MVLLHRFRTLALTALFATVAPLGWAQPAGGEEPSASDDSSLSSNPLLDAELFYEIFLGEISARAGDPGAAYALMLEAARRSGDGQLYKRAADIALQSRSGEYALAAAKAWKDIAPDSREANRYVLQILVALNRIGETAELLRQELAQSPPRAKVATITALAQLYGRASDKALAAKVVEQALVDELTHPATGPVAWVSVGRLRLAADDKPGALAAAQQAQRLDVASEDAARLALMLMEAGVPEAEPLVTAALAKQPVPALRMDYARVLIGLQRYPDAQVQLQAITRATPDFSQAWLALGTLQYQSNRLTDAQASLQRFIDQTASGPPGPAQQKALTQAYLLNAQIAEKNQDYAAAQAWLDRIADSGDLLEAQVRRASLLARQGKLPQARVMLRNLPATSPDAPRMRLLAEVQLLRGLGLYEEAYTMQTELATLAPDDAEVVYDQAMLAEKAGKLEVMEQLLRQVIARHPQYHHAYNALGYSFADRGVQLKEARQLIMQALTFAPGDPFILDSLGWLEFRAGNKAQARVHLEAAYKARPDVEIATHLGEVLLSMGDKEGASRIWKEAQRTHPDNEVLKSTLKRLGVSL